MRISITYSIMKSSRVVVSFRIKIDYFVFRVRVHLLPTYAAKGKLLSCWLLLLDHCTHNFRLKNRLITSETFSFFQDMQQLILSITSAAGYAMVL